MSIKELLKSNVKDVEIYIKEVIDYLENKEYYDKCGWYDFNELVVYFKSTLETISEIYSILEGRYIY